jgi:YD repeat-containing protein
VWSDSGVWVDLPRIPNDADEVIGPYGWLLRRTSRGLLLDCDDGVFRLFSGTPAAIGEHQLVEVRDKSNNTVSLSYDEHGRLVGATDCVGRRVRFEVGDDGLIAAVEAYDDTAQQWLRFAHFGYGARGEMLTASDAAGRTHRFSYDEHTFP